MQAEPLESYILAQMLRSRTKSKERRFMAPEVQLKAEVGNFSSV